MSTEASAQKVGRPRVSPQREGDLAPRDQILDAAAGLFAEHGYAGTSTRAIAERVGIRQASLYYHFAGKDEILLELLEISVRPSLAFVDALLAHDDSAAALYALVLIDVQTLLETPYNIGTLYLAHLVQQPRFDSFRAHRAELQAAYSTLAGAHGDDAGFLGAACMQLVEMVITLRRDGEPDDDVAVRIALACLRLLGVSPADAEHAVAGGELILSSLAG
ncbi:MAG: helix-turn-helix domain-containing protein [Aeromicrobium sp.]